MGRLTSQFVKNVKESGSYPDGQHGLTLLVSGKGAKSWVQRFTIKGQRRVDRGLGSAKYVSLKEARDLAFENARLGRQGIDPKSLRPTAKEGMTFEEAAHKTHAEIEGTYKNPKDHDAFINSLTTHVFPTLGAKLVTEITTADIRGVLIATRVNIPAGAAKVEQRIRRVFKWALAEGIRDDNPALSDLLVLPKLQTKPRNQPSLPYADVPKFLQNLHGSQAAQTTKHAIEFLILTASRSRESREAVWSEFDLDATIPIWTVPGDRMKMGRNHRVPLCSRAVEIIRHQKEQLGYDAPLFPGMKRGKALTDMALLKLAKSIGGEITIHGFRTSFRTWAQEKTDVLPEVAEAALAHSSQSTVEAAYARSDLFEKRYDLMCSWEEFLQG